MAQLLIRNLDEKTIERLKTQAKRNNRSLQGETKATLERVAMYADRDEFFQMFYDIQDKINTNAGASVEKDIQEAVETYRKKSQSKNKMIRVVLDANQFVSALLKKGSNSDKIIRLVHDGTIKLVMSKDIVEEIRGVLNYPKDFKTAWSFSGGNRHLSEKNC